MRFVRPSAPVLVPAVLSVLLAVAGCGAPRPVDERPLLAVSFSIWGDAAGEIAGDRWRVRVFAGPGKDVHSYAPTPDDAVAATRAALFVRHGLHLDDWMVALRDSAGSKAPLATLTEGVPTERGLPGEGDAVDPHVWQDPRLAVRCVSNLAAALAVADPAGAPGYAARYEAWRAKAEALDAEIRAAWNDVPAARRAVITTHDAFGYYGRAFGVRFHAAMGLSTESEPTAKTLAALLDQMRREKIRAVFLELRLNPALAGTLAKDGGGFTGGTLYPDTLSAPDGPAPNYFALLRHNTRLLVDGARRNP